MRSLSLLQNRRRSSAAAVRASLCLIVAALGLAGSSTVAAAAGDDYGELARWGGASATGDAKIGEAVGFAADPVDDSVYVADVQSRNTTTGVTTFRLRKFAGLTGALEGSATFTSTGPVATLPPSIGGMAVDHGAKHVYLTVVAPEANADYTALEQIKVFDTEVSGGALVAPSDVADGELVGAKPLKLSALIAVNPVTHDVVVAGSDGTSFAPTVLRFRGTAGDGGQPGDAAGSWAGTDGTTPAAVAVASNGDILLEGKIAVSIPYDLVWATRVSADLLTATPFLPTAVQGGQDNVGIVAADAPNQDFGNGRLGARMLGSGLATAADGSLLATTIGAWRMFSPDVVTDPLQPVDAGALQATVGVRRLAADGEDAGILAGGAITGPCSLSVAVDALSGSTSGAYGVQAGAGGKFFAPSWVSEDTAEMVAFGPGGSGCPVPVPALAVSANGSTVAVDGTVPIGAATTLDLAATDLKSWSLMEVDWDLDGNATNGPQGDGFEVKDRRPVPSIDPETSAPSLQREVTFDTAGAHPIRARVLTTGGTSTISRTLQVAAAPLTPTVAFDGPVLATAGTAVTFDASGSHVNPAEKVAELGYEWDFGDGGGFVSGQKAQTHTFAAAGSYAVRVRVTDKENGLVATSGARTITVAKAPGGGGGNGGGGGTPQPEAPKTVPSDPPPVARDASATSLSPKLSVSGTTVSVALSCPTTKAQCSAVLTLRGTVKSKKGRRTVTKTITIGSGKATLAGGASTKVAVKLNSDGLKALKRAKRLKFTLAVAASDTYGGKKASTLTGTLKQPAAKTKKKK